MKSKPKAKSYRQQKKELEEEIADVHRAYAPRLKEKKGEDLEMELAAMYAEAEYAEYCLEELETWYVEKKAKRWFVQIDRSLYEENRLGHRVLDTDSREKVLRMVRDAQRENVKWWVGVVVPILGAVTGVRGLFPKKMTRLCERVYEPDSRQTFRQA